ncbi:Uncharacterised protein [Mycobacterium tuberculosis]|uniref:Uncharacterized protein n=1 Tax=Mycobacterium tuberculosis TaxID=1773 RepID=A0A654U205_MYCTX|nr:Uncharacterised protein [Mycobacterium tuberculosis]CPA53870.1 Uncharacterised protein [Mycobacterium tuberculosis]
MADLGHPGDEFFDLGAADRVLDADVGEDVGQVGHQPCVGIRGEILRRQVKPLGKQKQHGHGDGPLVILQLVDIACG